MRPELLARYSEQRLPRYTSYPTVPHFNAEVGADTYAAWLGELSPDVPVSLYAHLPFCRRMCWYCGCHTTITRRDEPIQTYLAALRSELELVSRHLRGRPRVSHLHFGGGTPTIIPPDDLLGLVAELRERFAFLPSAEIAIEIDPRTLIPEMVDALGKAGVTRASLGVQSIDPVVQRAINRIQSFEETSAATTALRKAGVAGINFDILYGLPHQTVASCLETLERCLELRPDRFSVFGYAHIPSFKKHQQKIDATALPDGFARSAQAEAIAARLQEVGYRRIGLDHFARPEDPIVLASRTGRLRRNFQGYTTDDAAALLGFGASSIGHLPQGYVQAETVVSRYQKLIGEGRLPIVKGRALTAQDRLRARLIERVMCDFAVDLGGICESEGTSLEVLADVLPRLEELSRDGVITWRDRKIEVAEEARSLVRMVAAAFDAYLPLSSRPHSPVV